MLVRDAILGNQNPDFRLGRVGSAITDPSYRAGTFTLGQIDKSKHYLLKEVHLDQIVRDFVDFEWGILKADAFIGGQLAESDKERVIDDILRTLRFAPKDYRPLQDEVYFQEYSDIFRRILLTFVVNDPDREVNENPQLTTNARLFAFEIIRAIDQQSPTLKHWLEYSVIGGILGLDTKPNHAATSEVLKESGILIPQDVLDGKGVDMRKAAKDVVRQMDEKRKLPREVDDIESYFTFLASARQKGAAHIVCFTDDYIETILLLRFYLELLTAYPGLTVTLVPRSIRCGNDATARDIPDLKESVMRDLGKGNLQAVAGRILVSDRGPKIGGVHLEKLAPQVIELVQNATFLDVRGARNYEMMQRIKQRTFFGFMVARSTSEILTGLTARANPFFFKYQEPGTCSFKEIKN
jgi:uncharacterized protein with ATP-grasp and redox domains